MLNKIIDYIVKNKITMCLIAVYLLAMISVIDWGIPNPNHPYNYHMDEWHQLQSIRAILEFGSPNVSGAANGTIFHYLLSGIYLSPFVLLKIIDPILMQQKLFEILRINTLIFGVMSLLFLSNLVKKYFKINPVLPLIFFIVTPLWLSLSNYFKYDIALTFWIIASLFYLLKYGINTTLKNYIIAGVFCSLALATKISAIPLFFIYIFAFFYFNFGQKIRYKHLLAGISVFIFLFLIAGIPDLILRTGDYREYLYSNLIRDPIIFNNFIFEHGSWWAQVLLKVMPLDLGYPFYAVIIISFVYWLIKLTPKIIELNFKIFKNEIFMFVSMIVFILSLVPLELGANGNRLLVLLPFFAIFSYLFISKILKQFALHKNKIYALLIILLVVQFFQSFSMVYIKWQADPRQLASEWIIKYVRKGSMIGIENIPIYQLLPDLVVKEFYQKDNKKIFNYKIIDISTISLPQTVIITNREFDLNYLRKSPKKDLLAKLNKERYKIIAEFKPNQILYQIMGKEFDFYSSGIVPIPTITIYEQDKNPQN